MRSSKNSSEDETVWKIRVMIKKELGEELTWRNRKNENEFRYLKIFLNHCRLL